VLPTFLVVGAAKAGTTSLHTYLAAHPGVFMSDTKELNFFIETINWPKGLDWYREQFAAADGAHAAGESSPLYSAAHWYAGVPARIAATLPDVRLVYLVRDPIERMRSHYLEHLDRGIETRPPARAFRENEGYLNSSRYAFQLARFAEHVAPERILVLRSEDLKADRRAALSKIFGFIGVDDTWYDPALDDEHHRSEDKEFRTPRVNALKRSPLYRMAGRLSPAPIRNAWGRLTTRRSAAGMVDIPGELERELADRLRPDVAELRRLWLGPGFDGWGLLDPP
jgi:hypothetical protein